MSKLKLPTMRPDNLLLLLLFLAITTGVYAQQRTFSPVKPKTLQNPPVNPHARAMDLVLYPTSDDDCSLEVTAFGITDAWGFISGTNGYGDKEKAQTLEYTANVPFKVLGVVGFFDNAGLVGNGEVTAKVYTVNDTSGAPDQLLATSEPVLVADIVPISDSNTVELTFFMLPEDQIPEIESTTFIVSIDFSALYATSDTLTLFHTLEECGDGTNTWEKWSDDRWFNIFSSWDSLNADFLLGAVVEFDDNTTSADQPIWHHGLELYPASPNPASSFTVLNYGLEKAGPVEITIFDARGRTLQTIRHHLQQAGRHQEEIHTRDLAPGSYYYQITTGSGRLISTLMVQR